jgi:Uma2 family endonuclease
MATTVLDISPPETDQIPPLENGDHLSASEFLRRYEAMPEVKKAELIQGIVVMASPVRTDVHAEPDNLIQAWLGYYAAYRKGVRAAANATLRLGPDDVPQPDAILFREPGGATLDSKGYLRGSPELIVEIAASSVSKDAREKLVSYRRAGVREYLLWRVRDRAIDWFSLEEDEYRPLPTDDGVIKSRIFPGLWLHLAAAIAGDRAVVMDTLRGGMGES